jgi:hypothetical protein
LVSHLFKTVNINLKKQMMNKHDIVKKLLDSKAVDFNSIGKMVAEIGPSLSLADEPWEGFCATMRTFVHLYRLPGVNSPLENINTLGQVAGELR